MIIALARLGGLRTPSETLSLRLADLDRERGAMTTIWPKTEGDGQGQRVVPMFVRLRPYLEEAWETAEEG
jgi:integrase